MRLAYLVCNMALALALGGCAGAGDPRTLEGFPIDEGCADFHVKSPVYGGNRALAYASNCSSVGM